MKLEVIRNNLKDVTTKKKLLWLSCWDFWLVLYFLSETKMIDKDEESLSTTTISNSKTEINILAVIKHKD